MYLPQGALLTKQWEQGEVTRTLQTQAPLLDTLLRAQAPRKD